MRSGIKTTEFWLTMFANTVGVLLSSGIFTDDRVIKILGIAAALLSTLGYTYARTATKNAFVASGATTPPATNLPGFLFPSGNPRPDPKPYLPDETQGNESDEDDESSVSQSRDPRELWTIDLHGGPLPPGGSVSCVTMLSQDHPGLKLLALQLPEESWPLEVVNVDINQDHSAWTSGVPGAVFGKAVPVIDEVNPGDIITIRFKNNTQATHPALVTLAGIAK